MWPNPQETADLVTYTEEILNWKLNLLCSATLPWQAVANHVLNSALLDSVLYWTDNASSKKVNALLNIGKSTKNTLPPPS